MSPSTLPADPWTPPPDGAEWMRHPEHRANYVAALELHNEHAFTEAVEFLGLWRSEIAGVPIEDRRDTGAADTIAALVRVAHDRGQLGAGVAASFKDVAAAVGVSAERLAEAVRDALGAELAA